MQMVYNSDNFVVVQFDLPADVGEARTALAMDAAAPVPTRAGFEIVDKYARREIYIDGAVAEGFKQGVAALSETDSSPEALDEFIAGYTRLAQHPVTLH